MLVVSLLWGCGALDVTLPRGFAVIYGVAEYSSLKPDLLFPDNDAEDMFALLTGTGQGFSADDVILRLNSDATKAQLDADFSAMAERINALPDPEATRFVFYFAGHGYGDGGGRLGDAWDQYFQDPAYHDEPLGAGPYTEFLLLHGFSLADGVDLESVVRELDEEAESDDDLVRHLSKIVSRQKLVVIDACHSGGFIGDGTAVDSLPPAYDDPGGTSLLDGSEEGISAADALQTLTLYLAHGAFATSVTGADIGPDTAVVAAAGERESSYDGPASRMENGIFTYYFMQAAHAGDSNFDGFVTLSEAYSHAVRSISAIENPLLPDDFMPRLGSLAVDFVVFRGL